MKKTPQSPEARIEYVELEAIKVAKRNPKAHDSKALQASLGRFGFVEGLVVDERTEHLVAGHGRLEVLKKLEAAGGAPPRGIMVRPESGRWLVPVQRGWASKDAKDAEGYIIASNRIGESGGWDTEILRSMLAPLEGDALEGLGFKSADLKEILGGVDAPAPSDPGPLEPVKGTECYVKTGDLFALGEHRILCGDNTVPADLERLMEKQGEAACVIEDPPYAIYGSSSGIGADIADDKMVRPFFEQALRTAYGLVKTFGHVYVFTDWRSWSALWEGAKRAGLTAHNCLVWDKGGAGLGSMYAMSHEFVGFFGKKPKAKAMSGNGTRGSRTVYKPNVLRHDRVTGVERNHNASKPVGLIVDLLDSSTEPGELVVDLYCGGGSTLVACEQSGRRCYTLDLEPGAVQSAIVRWERITGKKAEKLEG